MARPVTLCTGQWADLPFEEVCQKASAWGYDGLEIACWGDHLNVRKAAATRLRQGEMAGSRKVQPEMLVDQRPPGRPVRRRPV